MPRSGVAAELLTAMWRENGGVVRGPVGSVLALIFLEKWQVGGGVTPMLGMIYAVPQ